MGNKIPSNYPILQFTEVARNDIQETWQYFGEFNEGAAEKLIIQIIDKCEAISMNPKIGRERSELVANLRQFPFKNYNIFYFPIENGVEIYRVLHSSRDSVQVFEVEIDQPN